MTALPKSLVHASLVVFAMVMFTSCSSKVEQETADLRREKAAGRYQSAYDKAEKILANRSAYAPESVSYAETVVTETRKVLTDHYGGNIRAQVASGNIDSALEMWSEVKERTPELVSSDYELSRRMMRVYARQGLWDRAKDTATEVLSGATRPEDREDAQRFLDTFASLKEAESMADSLYLQVAHLEDTIELDLSGGTSCGAASSEKLTEADRDLLREFEAARAEVDLKLSELLAFTNTLPAAVVAPQSLDESES